MSLQQKFSIVGAATLASRLGGFIRDAMVAAVLGAGPVADTVFAAFLLPNLFRKMFADGAFNASFIPIFLRRAKTYGPESAARFANDALAMLLLSLLAVTLLAWPAMPGLMALVARGFADQPDKFADTVFFARLTFPMLICVALSAFYAAVLNAVGRFGWAALSPIVLNGVMIVALAVMLMTGAGETRGNGLALSALLSLAGLLQLAFIVVVAAKERIAPRLVRPRGGWFDAFDPDVRRFTWLALPGLAVAGAGHVNILVAAQTASAFPSVVSWLYYADRLFQLPLGFVATAIGVVLLPSIAGHVQAGDRAAMRNLTSRSLEFALILSLPACAALIILSDPLVAVLYQRGQFSSEDALGTAAVLQVLAAGLPAFVVIKVILPGFLAREQFQMPLIIGVFGLVANAVTGGWLATDAGFLASAWGVTVSAWLNAVLLALALAWSGYGVLDALALRRLPRIAVASFATATALFFAKPTLLTLLAGQTHFIARLAVLALFSLVGIAVHLAAVVASGAIDWRNLRGRVG